MRFIILLFSRLLTLIPASAQEAPDVQALIQKATEGDAEVQHNLGAMYCKGNGMVSQDYKKAFGWHVKAAKQGILKAQGMLGAMYSLGQGTPQDYKQAYAWFNLVAMRGDEDAMKGRDIVASKFTPEALAQAQELSKEYYAKYVEPFQK